MKPPKKINPVVLRRGMTIGSANAETDDEYLFSCFIHYGAVDECARLQSPSMIVAGRTGDGKTAILRYIKQNQENSIEIDPSEMAMNYVANSDVLRFVQAIGGDIDLLFQVLWKHVLCIEFIRLRWQVDSGEKSRNIFDKITEHFSKDQRKKRSISYLREWSDKFWITMDENIKEITEKMERRLVSEFGADVEKFKMGGQYEKRLGVDKKSELIARSRKIINADQLIELHGIIEMLSNEVGNNRIGYYILIDKLDERWVDSSIRFRMIRGLIESLKSFRKIQNLKILVALRNDVIERVVQETQDLSFQMEKFEDYFMHIRWTKNDLKEMVNKRIRELFKRQYSSENINYYDIFRHKIGNKEPFEYMIEKTLHRPRDIIMFINEAIAMADGQYEVTPKVLRRAELEYSRKRRDALEQEWRSAFPSLNKLIDYIAHFKKIGIDVSEISRDRVLDDLALEITGSRRKEFDPFFAIAEEYISDQQKTKTKLIQEIVGILYRTGVVGVKIDAESRFLYSYIDPPLIASSLINDNSRIRIHPMLHGVLHLSQDIGHRVGRRE